jgi:hypothetical protein
MPTMFDRLTTERTDLIDDLERIAQSAADADRDLTDAETHIQTDGLTRIAELDALRAPLAQVRALRETAAAEDRDSAARLDRLANAGGPAQRMAPTGAPELSWGEQFVRSAAYTTYDGRGKSDAFRWSSPQTRAVVPDAGGVVYTGGGIGQALVSPGSATLIQTVPTARPTILDVISRMPWDSDSYDLSVLGSPSGAGGAAVVPEKAQKPEADFVVRKAQGPIDTIAFYRFVTRQQLRNPSYTKAFLEGQMAQGLTWKLASQTIAAIDAATVATSTGGGDNELENIIIAVAELESAGYPVNAILINPVKAAWLDITIRRQGGTQGIPSGLSVIPVPGWTDTLVGDFKQSVTLLERGGIDTYITDSDVLPDGKSAFRANTLTLLAEVAAAAVVLDEAAMLQVADAAVTKAK